MYARRVGDRELTFDFAAGLIQNNLLLVDRETGSLWSQLHGRAVDGPLEGEPLTVLPALQTTWRYWRQLHPQTRVMVAPGEEGRPYVYRRWTPGTPRPKEPPKTHDTSALGLGLARKGEAIFFPFRELEQANLPLHLCLGGAEITVHYRPDALTAWAEDADGNLLSGVLAYEAGWLDFHPESRVYRAEVSRSPD